MRRSGFDLRRSGREWLVLVLVGVVAVAVVGGLGFVAVALFLNRGPITGTVIGKDHSSMWVSCSGHPVICTTHPEEWEINVRSAKDPGRTKWVDVPAAEWSATKIGDQFSNGTDR